jgi:regulatory protein
VPARDPIEIAARSLRHRDRSRREIADRLERAGVDGDARADALDTLERVGYVDDSRFAHARAATLAGRGFGDEGIRYDLEQHGVAPDASAAALAALEPEHERAAALAARLGRTPKVAAALARKGFASEAIETAFGGEIAVDGP